jgi:hypothetical protein
LIRRIRVKRLSLDIIELEGFVIILSGNDIRVTNNLLRVRLILLESFELIGVGQRMIINIGQVRVVLLERFVPSDERVIKLSCNSSALKYTLTINIHVGNIEVVALFGAFVLTGARVGSAETLIDSVSVDTPHIGNFVFYVLIISLFSKESRGDEPKD